MLHLPPNSKLQWGWIIAAGVWNLHWQIVFFYNNDVFCRLIWRSCWDFQQVLQIKYIHVQYCTCFCSCCPHRPSQYVRGWPLLALPFLMTALLTLCFAITFSCWFPNNFSFCLGAFFIVPCKTEQSAEQTTCELAQLLSVRSPKNEEGSVTVLSRTQMHADLGCCKC